MNQPKITSVIELAKHPVGTVLYWVAFRPVGIAGVKIPEGDEWMSKCHPKVLYDRKLSSKAWRYRSKLPRLSAIDFQYVVDLLTSEPIVERFVVNGICRSYDTGEFYYRNEDGEWMPQEYLFETSTNAKREKKRIKDLFRNWANQASDDEV